MSHFAIYDVVDVDLDYDAQRPAGGCWPKGWFSLVIRTKNGGFDTINLFLADDAPAVMKVRDGISSGNVIGRI